MGANDAFRTLYGAMGRRRISRRGLMAGAAGAAGAAALSGGRRIIVPARAQEKTKVTAWTTFTPPDLDFLKQITEEFNAQSADVEAELVQIPPAEVTDVSRLITSLRSDDAPDVYHMDRFIVAQYAAAGALTDLSTLAGDSDPLAGYLPFAREEASYNGKPYALPFDTDTRALYYNKGLISSVGVDLAEFDPANGPITWDRLAEIATSLNQKDADGNYTQVGFIPWFNQGWHYTFGFSWGGDFYDEEACQVTPNDPNIVAAFQWVYDYCAAQGAQELDAFAGASRTPGFPPQENYFTVGTLATQITGDWHLRQMELYGPDIDYGVTYIPVPKEGDEPTTWAGGWSWVIPQGSEVPDAAYQFMSYLAGEPGQRAYTIASAHLPTLESLVNVPELYDEGHRFFAETLLPIAKNRPPLPVGALYWDELTKAWQATYLNEQEPQAALDDVAETVNAELEEFCP